MCHNRLGLQPLMLVSDLNVKAVIFPDVASDAAETVVTFERQDEHADPELIAMAVALKRGDRVLMGYSRISEGSTTINLGRSLARLAQE